MNEEMGLTGTIEYKIWDKDGYLKDEGVYHNFIADGLKTLVIDLINGTSVVTVKAMAVGTGAVQINTDTALTTLVSYANSSGASAAFTHSQPSANCVRYVATFGCDNAAGWTLTEAGLFSVDGCASGMAAYSTIANTLALADSIQLTWTLTFT